MPSFSSAPRSSAKTPGLDFDFSPSAPARRRGFFDQIRQRVLPSLPFRHQTSLIRPSQTSCYLHPAFPAIQSSTPNRTNSKKKKKTPPDLRSVSGRRFPFPNTGPRPRTRTNRSTSDHPSLVLLVVVPQLNPQLNQTGRPANIPNPEQPFNTPPLSQKKRGNFGGDSRSCRTPTRLRHTTYPPTSTAPEYHPPGRPSTDDDLSHMCVCVQSVPMATFASTRQIVNETLSPASSRPISSHPIPLNLSRLPSQSVV